VRLPRKPIPKSDLQALVNLQPRLEGCAMNQALAWLEHSIAGLKGGDGIVL
jgi:hypothetical protein